MCAAFNQVECSESLAVPEDLPKQAPRHPGKKLPMSRRDVAWRGNRAISMS
jgi:hypothetical protein